MAHKITVFLGDRCALIEVIDEVVAVADAPVVGAVEGGVKCRVRSGRPEAMKRERTTDGRGSTQVDSRCGGRRFGPGSDRRRRRKRLAV